jgi:hypothetical protein
VTTSQDIIEQLRPLTGSATNYAVSKLLNIDTSNFNRILAGTGHLGNEACYRAADLLDLDVAKLIASVEADRASPEKKAFWRDHAAAIVAALVLIGNTEKNSSFVVQSEPTSHDQIAHYAKFELQPI